jgi:hypothetical protein
MLTVINRKAFGNALINFPNDQQEHLKNCVWHGPKGFSYKPALRAAYGHELDRFFRKILKVPNATSAEAGEYLKELRNSKSTAMADVAEVYVFLQDYCANM